MPKDVSVMGGESADDIDELNKLTIKPYEEALFYFYIFDSGGVNLCNNFS
jgi:hypothetical protein